MTRVTASVRVENLSDGRTFDIPDALVDVDALGLSLPRSAIDALGLKLVKIGRASTPSGPTDVRIFGPVRLTIDGRDCPCEPVEVAEDQPARIGRIVLHALDLVVDPLSACLVGNPAHGGEHIIELY